MDWDKLRIFHAAAEAGSFTHAGEALRMSQSAVSRQVSALEKELKVSLFHRHARGLVLTEQGEMLFGTASEIMNKLSTAETLLTDTTTKPSGDLRITAPIGLGTVWVTQRLREFLELYPDIRIELVLQRRADRHRHARGRRRHLDQRAAAERADPPPALQHEAARLRLHRSTSAASARRSRSTPSMITRSSPTAARRQQHLSAIRWLETAGLNGKAPRRPAFSANSVIAMKYAIRAGIGIGLIPDYLTGDEADLVPVLQEAQLPTLPVYFVYPEELKTAKKVQVFRDFMVTKARQWKF